MTSHHITSHDNTSHHNTSHHITSHDITSHHITSQGITSHHKASHHITSHHITPHHITSHGITSHGMARLPKDFHQRHIPRRDSSHQLHTGFIVNLVHCTSQRDLSNPPTSLIGDISAHLAYSKLLLSHIQSHSITFNHYQSSQTQTANFHRRHHAGRRESALIPLPTQPHPSYTPTPCINICRQ